ncbi:MAG: endonuclease domain-containing protein [Candidatus Firestonebacteria bacterium]
MMEIFNRQETKKKRKVLRKNQTEAEKLLWSKLRNRQVEGYKFFRQYGIDKYIVDFYCPKLKLVIEIDGGQHYTEEGYAYDGEREQYMVSVGVKTMRFSNLDILKNVEGVFMQLESELPLPPL